MDFADIVSSSAAKAKSRSVLDRAAWLFGEMCRFVESAANETGHSGLPVSHGFLRASAIDAVLKALPLIRMSPSYEIFGSLGQQHVTAGAQATFDIGHAIHEWIQRQYLGKMRILWGDWVCVRCGAVVRGVMPAECACSCERFDYRELWVGDTNLRYRGHTDGLVMWPGESEPSAVVEIKSIATSGYDRLGEHPVAEHMTQIHAYMNAPEQFYVDDGVVMAEPRDFGPFREAYFIYVDKGKQAKWVRMPDGTFKVTSPPRWRIIRQVFDDSYWSGVSRQIEEMWAIHDSLRGPVDVIGDLSESVA